MRKFVYVLVIALVFAIPQTQAATADVPTYALLSLIGDKLDIVIAQRQSRSRADRSRRDPPSAIQDAVFDNAATTAAGEAVRKIIPGAELAYLNSRSTVLFEKQRELFAEKNGVMSIPDAIRDALKKEKATHLILITKYGDEAQFQFVNAPDGTGMLEGLGFYLDGATGTFSTDEREAGRGYIAPFVYAKVTLIDVQTSRVIRNKTITASLTISSARAQENLTSPWLALSAAEKVSAMNRLIQRELARTIPLLLKAD
ncbi:MAG: hypothetical protein ABI790_13670 [Betaproteobacteria bacterium]